MLCYFEGFIPELCKPCVTLNGTDASCLRSDIVSSDRNEIVSLKILRKNLT